MHIELQNCIPERAFSLWFIFSWQGDWFQKKKKSQTETKIKPCIDKSKTKNKRVAQLAKAQMREEINKNAFLQCLGPTLLSQEKAPNQSQLDNTSSSPSTSTALCPLAE